MKYELDVFKPWLRIKDLFKSKLLLKSLNNFSSDFKKEFNLEILDTIDLDNPYKSEWELFEKLNKIFWDEDIFMFYIRFLEKNWYIKHTKSENIWMISDVFEYFINLTKKQANYPIDLVVSKVNTKIIDIVLDTKIENSSLKLISLGYKTIPNEWWYIDKIYEDEISQWHMKVSLKDWKTYYYNKNWDFLKTSEWKRVSHTIYSSKTKQWIISKIIDEFNEEYVVWFLDENKNYFEHFVEKEFDLWNNNKFKYFELKNKDFYVLIDENFERINLKYVIKNFLWWEISEEDWKMIEDYDILEILKYYDFDWNKYIKVSISEPEANVKITFNTTRFKDNNKKNLFTFIIDSNWKILKEEEDNSFTIISDLYPPVEIAWKKLLPYSIKEEFKSNDWFIDWESNIVTIDWEILYNFEDTNMDFKWNNFFKIRLFDWYNRKEITIKRDELENKLENYISIWEDFISLKLEKKDNVKLDWESIDKIIVQKDKLNWLFFSMLWKKWNRSKLNYMEFIHAMKKTENDNILKMINISLSKFDN